MQRLNVQSPVERHTTGSLALKMTPTDKETRRRQARLGARAPTTYLAYPPVKDNQTSAPNVPKKPVQGLQKRTGHRPISKPLPPLPAEAFHETNPKSSSVGAGNLLESPRTPLSPVGSSASASTRRTSSSVYTRSTHHSIASSRPTTAAPSLKLVSSSGSVRQAPSVPKHAATATGDDEKEKAIQRAYTTLTTQPLVGRGHNEDVLEIMDELGHGFMLKIDQHGAFAHSLEDPSRCISGRIIPQFGTTRVSRKKNMDKKIPSLREFAVALRVQWTRVKNYFKRE